MPLSIQDLEMGCLDQGLELPPVENIRRFYQFLPFVVGASAGEETCYVYVEWHSAGDVHGRPITRDELVTHKGMQP